jgi:hypothetical protein
MIYHLEVEDGLLAGKKMENYWPGILCPVIDVNFMIHCPIPLISDKA